MIEINKKDILWVFLIIWFIAGVIYNHNQIYQNDIDALIAVLFVGPIGWTIILFLFLLSLAYLVITKLLLIACLFL